MLQERTGVQNSTFKCKAEIIKKCLHHCLTFERPKISTTQMNQTCVQEWNEYSEIHVHSHHPRFSDTTQNQLGEYYQRRRLRHYPVLCPYKKFKHHDDHKNGVTKLVRYKLPDIRKTGIHWYTMYAN